MSFPCLLRAKLSKFGSSGLNSTPFTDGEHFHIVAFSGIAFVGVFCELDEPVDEVQLDLLDLLAVIDKEKSVELADRLPQLGVKHVFHAILGPEWRERYLPSICLLMSAQRLP
jgi:hypothetical protein